jgi:homoserine kinase
MTAVHIRVPASTSNLGAGFDCVGIAVDRWLTVTVSLDPASEIPHISREGTLSALDISPNDDWILVGFLAACAHARQEAPRGITVRARSTIPIARGLGSSAAATVAGAVAANALLELALDEGTIAGIAVAVEGHPDNVAPAVFGGATLAIPPRDGALEVRQLAVAPGLSLVFAVPDFPVETAHARAILPSSVPHRVAARAAALGAALVQGLATGDGPLLSAALDDVLHVPFRRDLVPGLDSVLEAARAAGAYGATLSGSGSGIVAIIPREIAAPVAQAMCNAWVTIGVAATAFESATDIRGYEVTHHSSIGEESWPSPSTSPPFSQSSPIAKRSKRAVQP